MDVFEEARVAAAQHATDVEMNTNGPCIAATVENLENGVGAKPLPRAAIERTRTQACRLLASVLTSYEREVAAGEVGANGSGRASSEPPIAGKCPTGLLYGRIQSGKTVAMITFAALAIDNGFRVIVVLTSDNVKLVEQTAGRFAALDAITTHSGNAARWGEEREHFATHLTTHGLLVVCAKNVSHLDRLVDLLRAIGADRFPALILDDEADQATLDTNTRARSAGGRNANRPASTINARAVQNDRPDQAGESVAERLPHRVFIQVTATPYALLLQNIDNPLRPKFTELLDPGEGYTGGEAFFTTRHIDDELPPIIFVPEAESDELETCQETPEGLARAITFFLVAAGAQACADPTVRGKGQNFLCHTSQRRDDHARLSILIRSHVQRINEALTKFPAGGSLTGEVGLQLEQAYSELLKTARPETVPRVAPLNEIVRDLARRLPRREIVRVNSDADGGALGTGINFIVGGNILGRGLTIDNLLVTYYLRRAKVSQMDTLLQHARMFGYRHDIMPYTRVFLPEKLALRFHRIHVAEENLRLLLRDPSRRGRIPVEVGQELRATRPGVLDTRSVIAYTPGQHIYPAAPDFGRDAHGRYEDFRAALVAVAGEFPTLPTADFSDLRTLTIDQACRLIELAPYDSEEEDSWDPRALIAMLRGSASRFDHSVRLHRRPMRRTKITEGALSGDELRSLRQLRSPTLCVFQDDGGSWKSPRSYQGLFFYPTLVLPDRDEVPAHVFNVRDE